MRDVFNNYTMHAEIYYCIMYGNFLRTRWCYQNADTALHMENTEVFMTTCHSRRRGTTVTQCAAACEAVVRAWVGALGGEECPLVTMPSGEISNGLIYL